MIENVRIKELKMHNDERGRVMELLRADDEIFSKFGQVYMTTNYPGVIKAWHCHKKQTDYVTCVRGSEASLVRVLEEKGIGRPSTYAKIIDTLGKRDYISKEDRKFIPSILGIRVVEYLEDHFKDLMNYNFTAELEKQLDQVSEGKLDWVDGIEEYYGNLEQDMAKVQETDKVELFIGKKCPECGNELIKKYSHRTFGWFIGCNGYPECKYTEKVNGGEEQKKDELLEKECPKCGLQMVKRYSPKTRQYFIGCTGYPKCKHIETEQGDLGNCPECGKPLTKRFSRKTRRFFVGCSGYPDCTFIEGKSKK